MKKANITVSLEQEKLQATRRYMEKKDVNIEQELADALEKLYEKYVPAMVREYINETAEDALPKKIVPKSSSGSNKVTEGAL